MFLVELLLRYAVFVLNTSEVFMPSLSEWSFGFSNVLETTLRAVNDVNQVAQFAADLVYGGFCIQIFLY